MRSDLIADGDNTAEFGSNATYSCTLTDPTGVLQVTWQRLHKDQSVETLATYSKRFGRQINEHYREKVFLNDESLTSTAITVVNVTWEDEACYVRSFNIYPSGSQRKQICVSVQGIASVEVKVQLNTSTESEQGSKALVSCSANGKPAPVIQWIHPKANPVSEPEQTQSLNSDQTVTTTSVISLRSAEHSGDYVECVVNTGRIGHRKKRVLLPAFRTDEKTVEQDASSRAGIVGAAVSLCICSFCICMAGAWWNRRKGGVRNESTETRLETREQLNPSSV